MQEVFEKTIEKLEELKNHYNECCLVDYNEGAAVGLTEAMNIVRQAAAEDNNGWFPCSERLPSKGECQLYDINHPRHRQFMCTIKIKESLQTRQLFFSEVFGWKYGPEDYNEYVIAWQPLPAPYKPKED